MIVVIGSAFDARARNIVSLCHGKDAKLLSAEDLCAPGWRLNVPYNPSTAMAVVEGKTVPASAIKGILTLRPCLFPEELQKVAASHRQYVAAELNAFLLAFLSSQSCPVLNRPTAGCLSGPNWQATQWTQTAARFGISAQTRCTVPGRNLISPNEDTVEVISVGNRCFGTEDPTLKCWTLKLAHAANVDLLSVRYASEDGHFISASLWPALKDAAVLDEVLALLEAQP